MAQLFLQFQNFGFVNLDVFADGIQKVAFLLNGVFEEIGREIHEKVESGFRHVFRQADFHPYLYECVALWFDGVFQR
jgi:hypothetical protein